MPGRPSSLWAKHNTQLSRHYCFLIKIFLCLQHRLFISRPPLTTVEAIHLNLWLGNILLWRWTSMHHTISWSLQTSPRIKKLCKRFMSGLMINEPLVQKDFWVNKKYIESSRHAIRKFPFSMTLESKLIEYPPLWRMALIGLIQLNKIPAQFSGLVCCVVCCKLQRQVN